MKKRLCALSLLLALCAALCVVPALADGDAALPPWYPASTEGFSFFRDETAPRVVDNADIFTDDEERSIEGQIAEIRRTLNRDVVIYTDVTDYGLGQEGCAEDFYDYNGYGCGEEAEGVCLFIDMDPYDRGRWCSCSGSETMALYTEDVANLLDDALYQYLSAGQYGAGVADWVGNIEMLYRKGSPFAPEWYPAAGEELVAHHDDAAPRVVDELGLLGDAEVAALTAQAAEIAQTRGFDVAIHTAPYPDGLGYAEVARQYYTYRGYGFGDNYDGVLLTVYKSPGYLAGTRITARGAIADKLTETNEQRLRELCEGKMSEQAYYDAMSEWLAQVDHMARTGRVARPGSYWGGIAALGALIGSIFGGVSTGVAKAKMAPPREKHDADAYFDARTSRIQDAGRQFLYTTTSRRYSPPQQKSGGGGGGGRSSYHSVHSGSSGRSHSGSGRKF